jgi:exopolysaccharide biosynthesis protein
MLKLGVYEGLNLDGGGSTAMVVSGNLVNTPSDKNKQGESAERAVGNALLVVVRHP